MTKVYIGIGIVIILITGAFLFRTTMQPSPATMQKVSGSSFSQLLQENPQGILIDVRTPEEFSAGHINGARNIDFYESTFEAQIAALDPAAQYFVYCRSGSRSASAVAVMKSHGIQRIVELAGGVAGNPSLIQK